MLVDHIISEIYNYKNKTKLESMTYYPLHADSP